MIRQPSSDLRDAAKRITKMLIRQNANPHLIEEARRITSELYDMYYSWLLRPKRYGYGRYTKSPQDIEHDLCLSEVQEAYDDRG